MKKNSTDKPFRYDALKWSVFAMLTIAAFAMDYFTNFSTPVKMIGWIVWLVLSLGLIIMTERGNDWFEFAKAAQLELRKVVWPTRQETVQMTSIIIVVVSIVSLLLWAVDASLLWMVGKLTQLG